VIETPNFIQGKEFKTVRFSRQCPLVFLEKMTWRQGRDLGIEEHKVKNVVCSLYTAHYSVAGIEEKFYI
jgi:hypothetical protein